MTLSQPANWQNISTTAKEYIVTESGLILMTESYAELVTGIETNTEWVNVDVTQPPN